MGRKILLMTAMLFTLGFGAFAQDGEMRLNSCVIDDTLYVEYEMTNTTGTLIPIGGSNFVFDAIDISDGVPATYIDWAGMVIDTIGAGFRSADYDTVNLTGSNFANLTVVPDETSGAPGTGYAPPKIPPRY